MQMVSDVVVVRGFLFGAVVDDEGEEEERFIENLWRAVMNLSSDPLLRFLRFLKNSGEISIYFS